MKKLLTLLFALLICAVPAYATDHFGYNRVDSNSQFMWGPGGPTACTGSPCGLNVEGLGFWAYYNGSDAPGGAWYLYDDTSTSTANLTLPQALVSGTTYYAWFQGCDYQAHITWTITIGGNTSSAVATNNSDSATGCWTGPVAVVAGSATTTVTTIATRASSTSFLWNGFYITTDADATVDRYNRALNLTVPTTMDDSAAQGGNILQNSSFEEPINAIWGLDQHLKGTMADRQDCTLGHSGACSMKLPLSAAGRINGVLDSPAGFNSQVFHLAPNKKYSFGCYVKLDTGSSLAVAMGLVNVYIPPAGYPSQYEIGAFSYLSASDGWLQITTSTTDNYSKAYPSSDFYISIQTNGLEGSNLNIDDCFIKQGDDHTYAPPSTLDTMISTSQIASIYYDTDTLTGTLTTYNSSGSTATGTLAYEIYDRFQSLVASGTTGLSVGASTKTTASFSLATGGKIGTFRLVYWQSGVENSEKELNYAIIKPPATAGVDTASYLGIHPNYLDYTLPIFQRLGMKWARAFSPFGPGLWSSAEPTEGSFTYYDSEMNLAYTYGFTPLMLLIGDRGRLPSYAVSGACGIDLTKTATFVSALVNHYKGITHPVKYYEIANEPHATWSASCYADILKTSVDAVEAADATAKVICMGGTPATYIADVITALGSAYPSWDVPTHCPTLSSHEYPDGQAPEGLTTFVTGGYEMWNTETGAYTNTNVQGMGSYANISFPGKALFPYQDARLLYIGWNQNPNIVAENFARTIASGFTNFEYYDGRIIAAPNSSEATTSNLAYDFTMRPSAISYAVLGHLIDKAIGQGNKKSDGHSYLLSYDTGGTAPVAVLFSGDNASYQAALSGISHGDVKMYDMMGNELSFSGTTIPFGRNPVYLVGQSISISTLNSALSGSTVSTLADAVAPNVVILDAPRATIAAGQGNFRTRWLALDNISFPNLGEVNPETVGTPNAPAPDALVYSFKLTGYTDWSAYDARTYYDYSGVPDGTYEFSVRAKDEAGNVSATATRNIQIGEPAAPPDASKKIAPRRWRKI